MIHHEFSPQPERFQEFQLMISYIPMAYRPRVLELALMLILIAASSCGPDSVVAPIVSAAVLKKVGSELIEQARASGASLIAQGEASGNALLIKSGNEINVQADNTTRLVGAQISEKVSDMDARFRPSLASLNELIENSKHFTGAAYEMKDAAVLDVRAIIATWPVIGQHFYVQAIRGITVVRKPEADYKLSITGTGLGIPTSGLTSNVALRLNGALLAAEPERTDPHTALFTIRNKTLVPLFKERSLALVPAAFEVSQTIEPWYHIGKKTYKYSVPVKLALMPYFAGSIRVTTKYDDYDWKFIRTETRERVTGDHNCPKCSDPPKAPYSIDIVVPNQKKASPQAGDQKLQNGKLRCVTKPFTIRIMNQNIHGDSSACGWSSASPLNYQENDSRVLAQWLVWGSPTTWEMSADVYEYVAVSSKSQEQVFDLYFDKFIEITIPKKPGVYGLGQVATFNKEAFPIVLGESKELLKLEKAVDHDAETTYVYSVRRPEQ